MKLNTWAIYILQYMNVSLMQKIIWITILVSMLLLTLSPQNPLTTGNLGEELVHLVRCDSILTSVLMR